MRRDELTATIVWLEHCAVHTACFHKQEQKSGCPNVCSSRQERVQHRASAGDEVELVAGGSWHILSKISPFCQRLFLKPHNTRVTPKSSFLGSQHSIAELASRLRARIFYGLCDLLQSLRAYIAADVDPSCMLRYRYRMARSAGD